MARKAALLPFIILGLIVTLTCKQWIKVGNDDPGTSKTSREWTSYDLDQTDIKVDLPVKPKDQTPAMPPSAKEIFSAMHIYSYDDKDFQSSFTELVPTGKRKWVIKDLADTSMAAIKKQLPDLTYTLDIKSDTNAKYNGSFTRNGKGFDVRGCCVYKKSSPARVWAVITLYPRDNADSRATGEKIIDSVLFKGSSEECK